MSKAELERFSADLNSDQALYEEVAAKATDAESLAAIARARGYDVTADEAGQLGQHRELTEEQLDKVAAAGGFLADRTAVKPPTTKFQPSPPPPPPPPPPSVLPPASVLSVLL
jgi:predicted ribosomally synthesized peptide with nif11-like leader